MKASPGPDLFSMVRWAVKIEKYIIIAIIVGAMITVNIDLKFFVFNIFILSIARGRARKARPVHLTDRARPAKRPNRSR
jgi:hypothetical protein